MDVESVQVPPQNILNGKLEIIIIAYLQTLKRSN